MYYFLKFTGSILSQFSDVSLNRLARVLATVWFRLFWVRRARVMKNLGAAFKDTKSDPELRQLAKQSYYHHFLTRIEFLRGLRRSWVDRIRIEGPQVLRGSLDGYRGAYVLCAPVGNWQVMGAALSRQICPAHVVVEKKVGGGIQRFVEAVRHDNGFLSIQDDSQQILTALTANEAVGFLGDHQSLSKNRAKASLAHLWLKHPAPVIPGLIIRNSLGNHTIKLLEPLEVVRTGDDEKDVLKLTQQIDRKLEEMIRMNPSQHAWSSARLK